MKVSELARQAGVTAETVRHYTRMGLLRPTRDPHNNYQLYQETDLKHLRFIQKARLLGFSLKEVESILSHEHAGDSPCPMVRDMMQKHLHRVREQIADLQQQLGRMEQALASWEQMPDGLPDGHTVCRLIEHWHDQEQTQSKPGNPQEGP